MVPNPIYEVFLIAITKIDHPDNSMTYSSANKKYLSVFTLPTIYSYYVNQSIYLHGSCIILLKVNYLVQFQHYLPMITSSDKAPKHIHIAYYNLPHKPHILDLGPTPSYV